MKAKDAASFLGQEVIITLGEEDGAPVIARGKLLAIDDWGECVVLGDDMGGLHYCWPMLDISPNPSPEVPASPDE